jgi:[ribosomal protein S5]-alanine N-acetyltransferase
MNIILRPWQKNDLEPLQYFANNIHIFNHVRDRFPHPYTLKDAEQWLALNTGVTPTTNFVIEADGLFTGNIALVTKEDIYRNNIEIGYWVAEHNWNKGIATKAIELICLFIKQHYNQVNRIYASVFETNKASMRALEKNGFVLECIHKKGIIKNKVLLDETIWVKFIF